MEMYPIEDEVVQRYKALVDIERGLRVLKSDLEIAAVYHRLPERIRSHALICFMSLVLYRVMRLKAHGSKASPKTELELLWRIQQHKATVGAKELGELVKPHTNSLISLRHWKSRYRKTDVVSFFKWRSPQNQKVTPPTVERVHPVTEISQVTKLYTHLSLVMRQAKEADMRVFFTNTRVCANRLG